MDRLEKLLREAFPADPLPVDFFRNDADLSQPDIPSELQQKLRGRKWTEITLHDWNMIGAPVASIIAYITPSAFRYYLPSLLLGSIRVRGREVAYDMAVEALLPANQWHVPRGAWWQEFFGGFDERQKAAVREFLRQAASAAPFGCSDKTLATLGLEKIWG